MRLNVTVKLHHVAAALYAIVFIFLISSWALLLAPLDTALGQLELIFDNGYANRPFFVWYAIVSFATLLPALVFWSPRAASAPLHVVLVVWAATLFVVAVWQFDATLILGFGFGLALSLWSWYAPDTTLSSGGARKRRAA
jgi:hypothetical protein